MLWLEMFKLFILLYVCIGTTVKTFMMFGNAFNFDLVPSIYFSDDICLYYLPFIYKQ